MIQNIHYLISLKLFHLLLLGGMVLQLELSELVLSEYKPLNKEPS